jgi:hypothetical protein
MVGPARFERATLCLEGRCSIQLSYGPVGLFYQRNTNPNPNYANASSEEAHAYTSARIANERQVLQEIPLLRV